MRIVIPTVEEERRLALRGRADVWKAEGTIDDAQRVALEADVAVHWKTHGTLAFATLFFLTALAVAATAWLNWMTFAPGEFLLTTIASIAVAEILIRRFHWFGTGVEQALWFGGLIAGIVSLPGNSHGEVILLFAAAAAVPGFRLRSAFLGTIALLLVVFYIEVRTRGFVLISSGGGNLDLFALTLALATALGGAWALSREWQRPSTERLLSATVVLIPSASLLASGFAKEGSVLYALAGALAVVMLGAGLHLRHHAPLVSGMLLSAVAAADLVHRVHLFEEVMLAIFGVVLLGSALAISRILRGRTRGIVIMPARLTVIDDAVETVASVAAAPHHVEAPQPSGPEGGGSFGGAGATGDY